jgi:hypothetical protein
MHENGAVLALVLLHALLNRMKCKELIVGIIPVLAYPSQPSKSKVVTKIIGVDYTNKYKR